MMPNTTGTEIPGRRLDIGSRQLTIFAVKQVAHGLPARLVRFLLVFSFVGVHAALGCWFSALRLAALRAAVGETGLVGLQLKLFTANTANLNGESHDISKR